MHPFAAGWHGGRVQDDPGDVFAYACDLFDHRYVWEAHEAWEGLWQTAPAGPDRELLQGLIQVSAALFKRHVGHADGARTLYDRGRARLADLVGCGEMRGIDLAELVRRLDRAFSDGTYPLLP